MVSVVSLNSPSNSRSISRIIELKSYSSLDSSDCFTSPSLQHTKTRTKNIGQVRPQSNNPPHNQDVRWFVLKTTLCRQQVRDASVLQFFQACFGRQYVQHVDVFFAEGCDDLQLMFASKISTVLHQLRRRTLIGQHKQSTTIFKINKRFDRLCATGKVVVGGNV
jgi:hypothetical protein